MTISANCACGANFQLRAEAAGKKFQCPECDGVITVPAPRRRQPESAPRVEVDDEPLDYDDYGADDYDDYEEGPSYEDQRLGAENGRHSITMSACDASLEAITPQRLQKACDDLLDYLAASPGVFKRSEIRLSVRSVVKNANRADATVKMSGTINGRQLHKTFQAVAVNYGTAARAGAISGGIVGALIGSAVDKALSKRGGAHGGLQQEFAKVRHKMFDACDKAIGRQQSKASGHWLGIQIGSGVAALLGFAAFFLFFKSRGDSAGAAAVGAFFPVVPIGALVLSIGMITMPDSFFLRDAAGRRALRLSGANSPGMARVVAGITAALMLALVIGIVILRTTMN